MATIRFSNGVRSRRGGRQSKLRPADIQASRRNGRDRSTLHDRIQTLVRETNLNISERAESASSALALQG